MVIRAPCLQEGPGDYTEQDNMSAERFAKQIAGVANVVRIAGAAKRRSNPISESHEGRKITITKRGILWESH